MSDPNREKQLEEALEALLEGWLSLEKREFLESEWEIMDEAEMKARELLPGWLTPEQLAEERGDNDAA